MLVVEVKTVLVCLLNNTETVPLLRFPGLHQLKMINNGEGENPPGFVLGANGGLEPVIFPFLLLDVIITAQQQLEIITRLIKFHLFILILLFL